MSNFSCQWINIKLILFCVRIHELKQNTLQLAATVIIKIIKRKIALMEKITMEKCENYSKPSL